MSNGVLGQILGSVFSSAIQGRAGGVGGLGAGMGGIGGLGAILGGMRGNRGGSPVGRGSALGAGGGALIGMLLPLAMQWVQRNGGIGAVLERFQQKGYGPQAQSWLSTGANQPLDAAAVGELVGTDELSRLSQQLDLPQEQVAQGFAEILPEMVNQLSPEGDLPADADGVFDDGLSQLQQAMAELKLR